MWQGETTVVLLLNNACSVNRDGYYGMNQPLTILEEFFLFPQRMHTMLPA
jgi:hypothetical protein